MTSDERQLLLQALEKLCDKYPHWRFGQLVANVAGWTDQEVWDVEDHQLLEAVQAHLSHADLHESAIVAQ